VPYAVKDTTWVKGRRVTNGSLLWKDFKPPRDAVALFLILWHHLHYAPAL
jgi:aspartyl-tRNA(Asn)/glutamyl-tRNA(Gln) amidotransferase subunit A